MGRDRCSNSGSAPVCIGSELRVSLPFEGRYWKPVAVCIAQTRWIFSN